MKKELHESLEVLKKAGFLVEETDPYMDDMDKELDQTLLFNKIVKALKDAGYTKCGIKGDSVYVWPVDATERYCVCIDKDDLFKNTFYCKVLDREKHRYAAKYYFTVQGDKVKRNGFGEPPAFYGPLGSIASPGQEYIESAIKPGFFKRLFHKESAQESVETLSKAGFLVEETDPYMDAMDDELDATMSFNTIKNIVEKKYKTEIKNGELYAYPIEDKKNIQIRIDSRGRNSVCSIFGVYLVDSNGETYTVKKRYKYYVSKKNPECHYLGKDLGYMEEYGGSEEEILKPAEEALAKLNKPGFFKRLFHRESAQESVETLSKAGFLVEASDKAKSIRDQITRVAIEKFEEIPYDEFEQEPWEDSDAIDAIPDEKFFEVMKSAINVKTQEEVLQAAEDEDKFNILADAWLEYLSDLSGYVGWEYTWNRDY